MSFLSKRNCLRQRASWRKRVSVIFSPEMSFLTPPKKSACGNAPVGGKWFQSFLTQKAPAAIGQPEENGFGHFWPKQKAPAAIGQLEENVFSQFRPQKRRLRQHASRRKMVSAKKSSYPIFLQNIIKILSKNHKKSSLKTHNVTVRFWNVRFVTGVMRF